MDNYLEKIDSELTEYEKRERARQRRAIKAIFGVNDEHADESDEDFVDFRDSDSSMEIDKEASPEVITIESSEELDVAANVDSMPTLESSESQMLLNSSISMTSEKMMNIPPSKRLKRLAKSNVINARLLAALVKDVIVNNEDLDKVYAALNVGLLDEVALANLCVVLAKDFRDDAASIDDESAQIILTLMGKRAGVEPGHESLKGPVLELLQVIPSKPKLILAILTPMFASSAVNNVALLSQCVELVAFKDHGSKLIEAFFNTRIENGLKNQSELELFNAIVDGYGANIFQGQDCRVLRLLSKALARTSKESSVEKAKFDRAAFDAVKRLPKRFTNEADKAAILENFGKTLSTIENAAVRKKALKELQKRS